MRATQATVSPSPKPIRTGGQIRRMSELGLGVAPVGAIDDPSGKTWFWSMSNTILW
jgi:hypothetical protein